MRGGNELVASLRAGVEVRTIGAEVLVYDPSEQRTHALDPAAAELLRRCDGSTSIEDIVADLLQAGAPSAEGAVAAVVQLESLGLVEFSAVDGAAMSRRRVIRRVATAGAVGIALPVIHSVAAPSIAAAQSAGGGPDPDPDPDPGPGPGATTFSVTGTLGLTGPGGGVWDEGAATLTFTKVGGGLSGTWATGPIPGSYTLPPVLNNVSDTINWSDGSTSVATAASVSLPASYNPLTVSSLSFTGGPFSSTVTFSFLVRSVGVTVETPDGPRTSTSFFSFGPGGTATVTLS